MPTSSLRDIHSALRPAVGELARTAAGLSRWSARSSPARLSAAVVALRHGVLAWLSAEQELLYPYAEKFLGGPITLAALREALHDLCRRTEALTALVSRLQDRPPTGAELDALRAGLYGLWATLGQHLSIEESVIFDRLDDLCEAGDLDAIVDELEIRTGRKRSHKSNWR